MKWQKQFSAYEIELQTSHRIRGEISVQSVIRRKAQRDRKNPAAVVRMEKVAIVEAEVCPDHIHMLLEIPPKIAVSILVLQI